MIFTKTNKLKTVFVIFCAVLLCFTSVLAYARYIKAVSVPTLYSPDKTYTVTMAKTPKIYDFGIYVSGDDSQLDSKITLENENGGTLCYSWDKESAQASDLAFVVDGYSPDANGRYLIKSNERVLNIPFSVIILSASRVGRAYLELSWTPESATAPTLFSRYLITLNPYNEIAPRPQIIADRTGFASNSVFSISATYADDLIVSRGTGLNEKFPKGTVYHSAEFADGVTLVNDSLIFLGASDSGVIAANIIFPTAVTEDISVSVGLHQQNCVTTTASPIDKADTLTAEFDKKIPVLNKKTPLALTVDNSFDLKWTVERFDGKEFVTDNSFASFENKKITLDLQQKDAPAGSYRVVLTQTYNGFTVTRLEKVFFVDYR